MKKAKDGDKVRIHYTVKKEDNTVFATSRDKQPSEFEIGSGNVPSGLQKGVIGMEIGETKTITVSPEEAFGPRREDLIKTVKKSNFPDDIEPVVGKGLRLKQPDGELIDGNIIDIEDELVTIDTNHPLAGHKLTFNVEMVGIIS